MVLYGDKNNWFAAYAYWYLKVYGHEDVRLLDGGRQKWIEDGRGLTTEPPSPSATSYRSQERDESIRVRRDEVLARASDGIVLVDVREPSGVLGASRGAAGLRAGGGLEDGPHPGCEVDSVGDRGPRRRHFL